MPSPRDIDTEALIAYIEASLRSRMRLIPTPPDDFVPLDASDSDLAKYGFPPRPARDSERAYDLWARVFSKRPQVLPAVFPLITAASLAYRHNPDGKPVSFAGRLETSRNWSGAVVIARRAHVFTEIAATWQVPDPKPPAGAQDNVEYRCSTWIGLDGHRRFSRSLPQLGTTQKVTVVNGVKTVRVEAWWQWWLRDLRLPPVVFDPNFAIVPGNIMQASLTVLTPTRVRFMICNTSTNKMVHAEVDLPSLVIPGFPGLPGFPGFPGTTIPKAAPVEGGAAEWITERTTPLTGDTFDPLANFETVTFSDCLARSDAPGQPVDYRDLTNARLLRLVDRQPNPYRSVIVTTAEKVDDESVTTTYHA
jgi:hypothetical protein